MQKITSAAHYIKRLIAEGEHQQLDFKFAITDSRKIAKTLVAFANTDGGTLLIGVKDNGNIAGIRSDEEYYMVEAAATMYCKPRVNFSTKKWTVEGKAVLEVLVEKSTEAPHFAEAEPKKLSAYIRIADENILANNVLIKVWKRQHHPKGVFIEFSEIEKNLLRYLENNDEVSLSKFCKITMISKNMAENILANLIYLDVIEIFYHEQHFLYRRKPASKNAPEPSRLSGLVV
ncbi:MAG: putative DNA binding domain-containing protein [Bacteroidota bacterium]|nr:putative DNA binding domain-containing protein [Bacteroidota bacterium]